MSTLTPTAPWQRNLPNWLTYSRMFCAIPLTLVMFSPELSLGITAAVIFAIGGITDYFDGFFARKYGSTSNFGKVMDPVADKILVNAALAMLVYLERINPGILILLVSRDVIIGGIRTMAASNGFIIDAGKSGKLKTAIQMVAIPTMMVNIPFFGWPLPTIAHLALWVSVVLSSVAAFDYVRLFFTKQSSLEH